MAMKLKRLKGTGTTTTFSASTTDSATSTYLVPRQLGYERTSTSLVFNDYNDSSTTEGGGLRYIKSYASTDTIGSGTKPIYMASGATLTASTSTVGTASKPVYMSSGTITAAGTTYGGTAKPVYMNSGAITPISATAGSTTQPVYLNAGTITAMSGTLATTYGGTGTTTGHCGITTSADTTSAATGSHGGTVTMVDSVTRDSYGHVTKVNTKTLTLPSDNNTTYSAGTGLTLSGTTFNHSNSITASTVGSSTAATLTYGGTFAVPYVTYDAQGHITATGTRTLTMPASDNTDTKVTNTLATTTKFYLTGTTGTTTNTGTQYFDTGVYVSATAGNLVATTFTGSMSTTNTATLNGTAYAYNGSTARSYSWYAPTSAGTSGYILKSAGSGAPTWTAPKTWYRYYLRYAHNGTYSNGGSYSSNYYISVWFSLTSTYSITSNTFAQWYSAGLASLQGVYCIPAVGYRGSTSTYVGAVDLNSGSISLYLFSGNTCSSSYSVYYSGTSYCGTTTYTSTSCFSKNVETNLTIS